MQKMFDTEICKECLCYKCKENAKCNICIKCKDEGWNTDVCEDYSPDKS